jgi:hypothetical protein
MTYIPKVNDYVKWETKGQEGWVYFKCKDYITIETVYGKRIKKTTSTVNYIVMIEYWYCVIIINGMNWSISNAVKSLEIMGKSPGTKSN